MVFLKKLYNDASVQDIADAIRAKNGSEDTYTIAEMAGAVSALSSGSGGTSSFPWLEGFKIPPEFLNASSVDSYNDVRNGSRVFYANPTVTVYGGIYCSGSYLDGQWFIDWGDGTPIQTCHLRDTYGGTTPITHTYTQSGFYLVKYSEDRSYSRNMYRGCGNVVDSVADYTKSIQPYGNYNYLFNYVVCDVNSSYGPTATRVMNGVVVYWGFTPALISVITDNECRTLNDNRIPRCFVINSNSVYNISNRYALFGSKFYVKDSLLNDYKSATNWVEIADTIKPLSECPYI